MTGNLVPNPEQKQPEERDGARVSPRTVEHPMAFTVWELLRGGLVTVAAFELLSTAVLIVASAFQGALLIALPVVSLYLAVETAISLVVMFIAGLPLAWLLGLALRRVRRFPVHLIAFALLGALAATLVELLTFRFPFERPSSTAEWGVAVWLILIPAAIATAFGWWCSATRALRDDARTV